MHGLRLCSILSLAALQRGLYTVVAASLIGSILSNLLLVLGGWAGTAALCHACRALAGVCDGVCDVDSV